MTTSFLRGFSLLPSLRLAAPPSVVARTSFLPSCRFFTTPASRLATAQSSSSSSQARPPSPPPSAPPKPHLPARRPPPAAAAAAAAAPSRYAFIKSLASKQSPTVLYEAPSHFWFYFGCWSTGLSILAWTVLTGPTAVDQPDEVPRWVGVVFGTSYVLLGAMGFYLISKTPHIVKTIRVLPRASGPAAGQPQLEVTVKRMLPFLRPRVIKTDLENVSLKSRFSLPEEYVPELRRLERELELEKKRKALHELDMSHLLTMPFRRIGRALASMFRGVRSAWTDMGFGAIKVDGKLYKVDVTKGFAHDGFKTLEQIAHVGFK
ncbi:hypothetical protein UVI_02046160 [Ustilaginoidea virens]|uniref:Uncharacterized protein n=1 Tax=Ustilaginoidea virens TaxID=1159556 RepID=A0A1B5L956_USTVR|nr:hypothetical protein UVI_02046160 [Ustilaginoidea virens]